MTSRSSFALAALLAATLAACSSAPPPASHPQPAPGAMGGDVLPPQARSAQPPARPVNPMLQQ